MNRNAITLVDGYVPVIDISSRDTPKGRAALAEVIGHACRTSGFFVIVGHGVPQELVDRMHTVTNGFFTLPEAEKERVAHRPGVSGFRRSGGTTARSLDQRTPPDLCESFGAHVTGELDDQERDGLGDYWATWKLANIWPDEPADFRDTWHGYMAVMAELSADVMRLFALALGLAETAFDDRFDRHVSSLVANYYYPQVEKPLPGQLRRGAHTDFGGLTVLYQQDHLGGLQVLQGEDDWRDVRAIPGSFVVNIGDLMSLWTGRRWVSTMHRVVNPEQGDTSSRLSIPFFYQPNHDAPAEPVLPPIAPGSDDEIEGVTAGEWMARKTRKLFTATS
ncbi:isopenicillin N synthase family dioxygenase [Streptoalloteichus hindustanus]|uniref:Isopenicillin N synthase n=1 Tax=Streptoalloteichus hindustanus TaxID=2017 RepID=A0A1M5DE08_STRHI|nr:2-oxoglutarate and iron-dependent oxygenase domain-containing protein [Streptoalloteichus hindustanus]SHF65074.1 Isopenicillin N synthase [Streptoalloteichus hindustanus]